jgi:hypothetical protein
MADEIDWTDYCSTSGNAQEGKGELEKGFDGCCL